MNQFSDKANFLWSIADLLRDAFKRSKYQDVILPFTGWERAQRIVFTSERRRFSSPGGLPVYFSLSSSFLREPGKKRKKEATLTPQDHSDESA